MDNLCLCTVTFGQKSSKLNSRPVYCSRLYGSLNAQPEMQILNGLQHMYTILRYFNVLHDLPFWKTVGQYVLLELQTKSIHATYVAVAMQRSLEGSTNEAYSNCFYFRISGILME